MSCYHPLKAFIVGKNSETGKNIMKVKPYTVEYLYRIKDDERYYVSERSLCPNKPSCKEKICDYSCLGRYLPGDKTDALTLPLTDERIEEVFYEFETIPCGKCDGCRVDKSKEWANRLMMEEQYSSESWFLTLTYDNEHVPKKEYVDKEGEIKTTLTLNYKDFQDFMKRLRKHYGEGIRFYCAGEYGSMTFRPHYHAIVFNMHLEDKQLYGKSDSFDIFESPTLDEIWKNGKVIVAPVNWATCAYVARYVTKKFLGEKYDYWRMNIEPEFAKMSRKPGIGYQFYEEHKEQIYESYIIRFGDECNAYEFPVPQYFNYLMAQEDESLVKAHKANKKKEAVNAAKAELTKTDLDYLEYLEEVKEHNFREKCKYQFDNRRLKA